jgi:hypothetical protein
MGLRRPDRDSGAAPAPHDEDNRLGTFGGPGELPLRKPTRVVVAVREEQYQRPAAPLLDIDERGIERVEECGPPKGPETVYPPGRGRMVERQRLVQTIACPERKDGDLVFIREMVDEDPCRVL